MFSRAQHDDTKRETREVTRRTIKPRHVLAILDSFPEAVVLRNGDGQILFVNRKAEQLFSVRRADIVAHRMFPSDARISQELRDALAIAVPLNGEVKYSLPQKGRAVDYMVTETTIDFGEKKPATLRIFREASQEEKRSKTKSQFLSIAAHQLRVPISGIRWVIDLFLKGDVGPLTDEQRDLLSRVQVTTERMVRLVAELLDVSRIEEGRFSYRFRVEHDVPKLLSQTVESFRQHAEMKGMVLTFVPPDSPLPPLRIDPDRLLLAFENVLANAINYTIKGSVTVRVTREDAYVVIEVADTGIGIPAAQREKLFTKFFRAENVERLGIEGTGLGLFIARTIMRRHGGDIEVDSQEGKGTRVRLLLPVDASRLPEGDTPFDEAGI